MKVTTRTPVAKRRRQEVASSHRGFDILGVLLFAFALLALLSMFLADTGLIGGALHLFFTTLFGHGAWAVPFLLGGLGFAVISGKRTLGLSHLSWGLTLIFLGIVAAFARDTKGDYFELEAIKSSGGYLGAIIAYGLGGLFGSAKFLGIGVLWLVGFILCVDTPIRAMLSGAKDKASATLEKKRSTRAAMPPREKPERKGDPALPEAFTRNLGTRAVVDDSNSEPGIDDMPATPAMPPEKVKKQPIFTNNTVASSGPTLDLSTAKEGYQLPPMGLLADVPTKPKRSQQEMQKNIETLEGTLEEFGIEANVVEVATGPTITRYEIQLGPGVRVAKIVSLADNIAMNLAANSVRVEAPIPGKAAIGVEVPNSAPSMVTLREVCDSKEFRDSPSRLIVALGQDVSGANKYADLTRMPHLLIGGATNSGKSIGLATLITSLLMRNTPKDLRLVMIDPKRVELTLFDGIPHLMCPVIKDVKEAPGVLRAVWREMDRRYDLLSEHGVRNIQGWNEKASFAEKLPYIVVIIDELADLMIQAAAEVETSIVRLAQLARAVGIHLVIATQRPSVDVITGIIKANIPSRIAFSVASQIDSRTILDQKGAEALIGKGDMLFMPIDATKPLRVQGCYVSEKEIDSVCKFWREQEAPQYVLQPEEVHDAKKEGGDFGDQGADPLWEESVTFVVERGQASTSMLQRRFSIGFQRASRLLDMMEERAIVGPRDGPRPREVLVSHADVEALFGRGQVYETGWIADEEPAS